MWRIGVVVSGAGFGDVFCPLCGSGVKWDCAADEGGGGQVHCQSGRMVSSYGGRVGLPATPCSWSGASCTRRADDEVVTGPEIQGAL